jgi:hypothetical protein
MPGVWLGLEIITVYLQKHEFLRFRSGNNGDCQDDLATPYKLVAGGPKSAPVAGSKEEPK